MTTPEWGAADEDDSDRFPADTPADQPVSGSTVTGDAEGAREARYAEVMFGGQPRRGTVGGEHRLDVLAAVVAVADEEQAALRRTVDGLQQQVNGWFARAEAAEDRLRKVAELADEWQAEAKRDRGRIDAETVAALVRLTTRVGVLERASHAVHAILAAPPAAPEAAEVGEGEPDGCRLNGCHPAPVSSGEAAHEPLEVRSYDDGWFLAVVCSCSSTHFPTSSVWLEEHWQGTKAEGVAKLRALVAEQREEAKS